MIRSVDPRAQEALAGQDAPACVRSCSPGLAVPPAVQGSAPPPPSGLSQAPLHAPNRSWRVQLGQEEGPQFSHLRSAAVTWLASWGDGQQWAGDTALSSQCPVSPGWPVCRPPVWVPGETPTGFLEQPCWGGVLKPRSPGEEAGPRGQDSAQGDPLGRGRSGCRCCREQVCRTSISPGSFAEGAGIGMTGQQGGACGPLRAARAQPGRCGHQPGARPGRRASTGPGTNPLGGGLGVAAPRGLGPSQSLCRCQGRSRPGGSCELSSPRVAVLGGSAAIGGAASHEGTGPAPHVPKGSWGSW